MEKSVPATTRKHLTLRSLLRDEGSLFRRKIPWEREWEFVEGQGGETERYFLSGKDLGRGSDLHPVTASSSPPPLLDISAESPTDIGEKQLAQSGHHVVPCEIGEHLLSLQGAKPLHEGQLSSLAILPK